MSLSRSNGIHCTIYSAINSHWQNSRAEKRIRDLIESETRQPYPLRTSVEISDTIPDKEDASCQLSIFSNLPVQAQLRDKHPFRCPMFALQTKGKNQQHFPRCNSTA
eukprot:2751975-Ditylum_brightwellii.AAC.1